MIKIATVEQVRAIEAEADATGIAYAEMMERAGRAAANRAIILLDGLESPRITILVGLGNNGGDGLVAGRMIAEDLPEAEVRFYLLTEPDSYPFEQVKAAGLFVVTVDDDHDKRVLRNMVSSADLVIDALFGIGVRLPIRDAAQQVMRQTNRMIAERRNARPEQTIVDPTATSQIPHAPRLLVMAIDCPSGLDCDTGETDSNIIAADETVTFIAAKTGQLLAPPEIIGRLIVADLGLPSILDTLQAVSDHLIDARTVRDLLPERNAASHKGTYGKILIAAGSVNYVGAPALAAEAAYRVGTGLVTVAAPGNVLMTLAGHLREVTWLMLPHDMGVIAEKAAPVLREELSSYSALLIGPGLGQEKTTGEFLRAVLQSENTSQMKSGKRRLGFGVITEDDIHEEAEIVDLPLLVLDADALNLLAKHEDWWQLLPAETILTPHPGEMGRLAQLETAEVQTNRWQIARDKAAEWNVILVLKGAYTLIAAPDGRIAALPFATDSLATAGTGDVLAGLITGLRAQGMAAYEAAIVGGYLHGLSGTMAANYQGSQSVLASDVIAMLGKAILAVIES